MTRRPIATVRVVHRPDLAEDCIRVEVDCPSSSTGITHAPGGPITMDAPMLTTFAVYEHEERCDGGCDTSQAHAQGSQEAREQIEAIKGPMQEIQARQYAEGRRN